MPIKPALSLLFAVLLLSGCISLYTPPVQQGNVVEPENLQNLKSGMTRRQVRFLLGTPLITDPFRQERWDYFYSLKKDGSKLEQRRITVFFKGDSLSAVEGNPDVTLAQPAAEPDAP